MNFVAQQLAVPEAPAVAPVATIDTNSEEFKRLLAEAEPGFESQLARESRSIASRGMTAEGREGIAAFLEKRAPIFRD